MAETKYSTRTIPKISLHDFPTRIPEITASLIHAAETDGFFALTNHGIPTSEIEAQFAAAERFFALPDTTKALVPFTHLNTGWEKGAQIRPSTGVADQKESYQMQYGAAMSQSWLPEPLLPGFKAQSLGFMHRAQEVSEKLMLCFARGLGFDDGYFVAAHDVARPSAQTVLRILHYFEMDASAPTPAGYYRAGAHADWDFVTLLFQRPGQSGLEICPGREVCTEFGVGDTWTKVEPAEGEIVCNIGDLLMSWSDDRFKSTFHRVKTPTDPAVDYYGPRYSMAYFNQPNTDCKIQGPLKKYPMVTGSEFTKAAMKRNYEALEAKKKALANEGVRSEGGLVAAAS
ncbi:Clavaminate synthase-like protein [Annulohypoxylon maeteangense]|uniref:Clavaminate synthase-like protein n=1 Tax=Annulohypoxylon maeteangense TaxID=1927788 RepID=UPI00200845CB|nr:Clavaminate synthase-like protein [Annulohypoxylon maeteangense]KAI0884264.1 Clavaminate synthase-like protein [Annulohypoxylon maeteangense]